MLVQGSCPDISGMYSTPQRVPEPRHTRIERKQIGRNVVYGIFYNVMTMVWVGSVVWVTESAMYDYENYTYPLKHCTELLAGILMTNTYTLHTSEPGNFSAEYLQIVTSVVLAFVASIRAFVFQTRAEVKLIFGSLPYAMFTYLRYLHKWGVWEEELKLLLENEMVKMMEDKQMRERRRNDRQEEARQNPTSWLRPHRRRRRQHHH